MKSEKKFQKVLIICGLFFIPALFICGIFLNRDRCQKNARFNLEYAVKFLNVSWAVSTHFGSQDLGLNDRDLQHSFENSVTEMILLSRDIPRKMPYKK